MKDKRNEVLAKSLVNYSVSLQPGETIMIEIKGKETLELAKEIIKEVTRVGGVPFWYYSDESCNGTGSPTPPRPSSHPSARFISAS